MDYQEIERALDELLVLIKAGHANQQELREELLQLQLKMELLGERTNAWETMLDVLKDAIENK